jgi:hypothetical protein
MRYALLHHLLPSRTESVAAYGSKGIPEKRHFPRSSVVGDEKGANQGLTYLRVSLLELRHQKNMMEENPF